MLIFGCIGLMFVSIAAAQHTPSSTTLVDFDATWRYHDGDVDLGDAWHVPDYDDAAWESGAGVLGYDTGDRHERWPAPGLQTQLTPHLLTYYMRSEFTYEGRLDGILLGLDLIVDDGAVVYLNGHEIGRTELMPRDATGFGVQTTSPITVPTVQHDVFTIDPSLLRQGRNVLAASVHNHRASSSDIAWAARLRVREATSAPPALYLTWQRDPTTTMTIHWHTAEDDRFVNMIEFGEVDGVAAHIAPSHTHPMPHSSRTVHTTELTNLTPDTLYHFRILGDGYGQNSRWYRFRTMPSQLDRPLRIAIGGDIMHRQEWMEQTATHAMRLDPDFIIWGGDLAYADGRADRVQRWYDYFEAKKQTLIHADGRIVPVVVCIGNHEILGHYYWGHDRGRDAYEDTNAFRESIAPYFYKLYAFPGHPGYGTLDFGEYLSLIMLDTDHSGPVEGRQTQWLEQQLQAREHMQHIIPVYHVAAFPSVRDFAGTIQSGIREHWVPLFEQHGVRLVFENHDHTYKRTVPIRDGEEREDGIVYIGDGAWGVSTRVVHPVDETWYLQRAESIRHFILLTMYDDMQDIKVISIDGQLIDHVMKRSPLP
jgi:3',5'-cyclic AMP phosphodiesterase CpdA